MRLEATSSLLRCLLYTSMIRGCLQPEESALKEEISHRKNWFSLIEFRCI